MASIDRNELDEVLATTFKELKTAINSYNKDSIALYSQALRALVDLKHQVDSQESVSR